MNILIIIRHYHCGGLRIQSGVIVGFIFIFLGEFRLIGIFYHWDDDWGKVSQ